MGIYDCKYAPKRGELKSLYIDIETCPNIVAAFSLGKQVVRHQQILKEREIIMIQYAWEGAKSKSDIHVLKWNPNKKKDRDATLLKKFIKIYNSPRVKEVITQNGDKFDIPWIRTRSAMLGLGALHEVRSVDLYKMNKKYMYFNSNSLDYLSNTFLGSGKIKMGLQDWIDIMNGCKGALSKMERYGIKDVLDLIKLDKLLRPYYTKDVTFTNLKAGDFTCPYCTAQLKKKGYKYVLSGRKQRYECVNLKHPKGKQRHFTESRIQKT